MIREDKVLEVRSASARTTKAKTWCLRNHRPAAYCSSRMYLRSCACICSALPEQEDMFQIPAFTPASSSTVYG